MTISSNGDYPRKVKIKKRDILFFLHIPKTAGTSFYSMLTNHFFPNTTLIIEDTSIHKKLKKTYPDELSRYRFFRQHADYYFYRYLPRKPIYLTFFRNPIARIVSLFNHIINMPNHPQFDLMGKEKNLSTFLQNRIERGINNEQIRAIIGKHPTNKTLTQSDLLEISKIRLNEITFFGIQEYYDDSLELFSYIFGWKGTEILNINKSSKKISVLDLSSKERTMIEENNQLDNEFYSFAVELFYKKINYINDEKFSKNN